MKPMSPSDNNGLGVTWLIVLQLGAEVLWQGTQECSCKVGTRPTTYFLHATGFKKKKKIITASHHLTSAKPRCSGLLWFPEHCCTAANLGDQPPAHTRHPWHCPSHCPLSPDVGMSPHGWDLALQRPLSLAGRWELNQAGFSGKILPVWFLVPTAKIQSIEAEGFKNGIYSKIHWCFIELSLLCKNVHFRSPQEENAGVMTHDGKEKGSQRFHLFSSFKPHF